MSDEDETPQAYRLTASETERPERRCLMTSCSLSGSVNLALGICKFKARIRAEDLDKGGRGRMRRRVHGQVRSPLLGESLEKSTNWNLKL